ncbi:MAG TPA: branched-chain amino acid ABC transporter permease, partial [Stellaceae bacterium]|nr:branched-chain amino acid ABC transporter permease [Stellaceae bacterium]
QDFYFLLLGLVAIVFTLVYRLEKSVLGLAWAAIREDQDAARGIGINTTFAKLCAFSTSASIGGLAGVIFAAYQRFVSPESFTFDVSLLIALIVVAGGIGNLVGVLVGAIILVVLPEALRGYDQYRMLIYGIVLVLIIMARPRGIVPRRYGIEWALRMLGWK